MLTVYKASAGSGKTFTLTLEYIRSLLGIRDDTGGYVLNSKKYVKDGRNPNRHRHILAITFTVAATGEMKNRIIGELNTLSDPATFSRSPYRSILLSDFGCTDAELCQAARTALAELLFDYRCFNVSTIDSFFQTVLRTFSREIDHQGDYELFIDREEVLGRSTSLMLDDLNHGNEGIDRRLYNWIRQRTYDALNSGNGHNLFNRSGKILAGLVKAAHNAMDETFGENYNDLQEYFADPAKINAFATELKRLIDAQLARFLPIARQALDMLDACGVPANKRPNLASRLEAIAAGRIPPDKDLTLKALTDPDAVTVKGIFASTCPMSQDDKEAFVALVEPLCLDLVDAVRRSRIYRQILDSLGELEFVFIVREHLEAYLREDNALLIADSGELLKRIISDAEMPFIYERIGMNLSTLLIDEFQDTSRLQWENLKPLVANGSSEGNHSLIIGDVKQAIYGFRNSDSAILDHEVEKGKEFKDKIISRGHTPADNTNHRSAADVVRFNNTLFSRLAAIYGATHFGNVVQAIDKRHLDQTAHIRLIFHDDLPDDEIIEAMCADIIAQHNAGYRWADIMVLCRRRSEAAAIVDYIVRHHPEISLLSSEALLLNSSPAVRAVVSMLRLVCRSYRGEKPTRGDAAPPYANRADVAMMITRFNHFTSQGYAPEEALELALAESNDAGTRISSSVTKIKAENPANLVALVEAIIAHRLNDTQRKDEYAYLAAFQDRVLKHIESPDPSAEAFLNDYDRNIADWAILAPADLDAVEVMTIHKSKGLQRACVHIPFGDWEMNHGSVSLWVETEGKLSEVGAQAPPWLRLTATAKSPLRDAKSPFAKDIEEKERKELLENLNNTYVAYTRAERELTVRLTTEADHIGARILEAITAAADPGADPATDSRLIDLNQYYNPSEQTLEIGEPTTVVRPPKAPALVAGEYKVGFRSDTRNLVSIDDILATDALTDPDTDKEIVDRVPAFGGTAEMKQAGRRGMILHSVLASMRTADSLDEALARECRRAGVGPDEQREFRGLLADSFVAGGPTVAEWFAPENIVYAERSIFDPATGKTYRPDRVIRRPDDRTVVIDYKFTTTAKASHRTQLAEYVGLLRSLGFYAVDAYLWYPLLGQIIKV